MTTEHEDVLAQLYLEDWEEPPDDAVLEQAGRFLSVLPDDLPHPELCMEPDGWISFDWMPAKGRVVSVSTGPDPRLPYAWTDHGKSGNGVVVFDGTAVPEEILELVKMMNTEEQG